MKRLERLVPAVLLALVMSSCAHSQSSADFAIKWFSLNSGGGQGASSASFRLSGTLGQNVAGYSQGSTFKLLLGFWIPEVASVPIGRLNDAKLLSDGTLVSVTDKIATTDFADFAEFFYIEELDRSSGIRVVSSSINGTLARGKTVSLAGTMATTSAGERQIVNSTVTVGSQPTNLIPASGSSTNL